ncbi:hypothetical protein [Ensifer soli]|uniref:hypothetical protein n=1 Tax=Ciceribacter sp. sgz301302 TaxID=3342379 RepID=UPI0035BA8E14
MVEIISKRDGPRREDAHLKDMLRQNRGTIHRLADLLSDGHYSRSLQPKQKPEAEGLVIHVGGAPPAAPEPSPQVRVTPNGRVIVADISSGRQMLHLGDLRDSGAMRSFVLATAAHGYIAPLDAATATMLDDLDRVMIGPAYGADALAADIGQRLDIPWQS